jgi:hypothetical protein
LSTQANIAPGKEFLFNTKELKFYKVFIDRIKSMQELSSLHRIADNVSHFLCNFQYWQGKQQDPDGWIYKPIWRICKETKLTKSKVETLRARLKELGIITESLYQGKISYLINWDHNMFGGLDVLKGKNQFTRRRPKLFKTEINPIYKEFATQITMYLNPSSGDAQIKFVADQLELHDLEGNMHNVKKQFMYLQMTREEHQRYQMVTYRSFFQNIDTIDYHYEYQKTNEIIRQKASNKKTTYQGGNGNKANRNTGNEGSISIGNAVGQTINRQETQVRPEKGFQSSFTTTKTQGELSQEYNSLVKSLPVGAQNEIIRKFEAGEFASIQHAINHIKAKFKNNKV